MQMKPEEIIPLLFKLLGMREGDETILVQIRQAIKRGLKNALCMREGCK